MRNCTYMTVIAITGGYHSYPFLRDTFSGWELSTLELWLYWRHLLHDTLYEKWPLRYGLLCV